MPPLKPATSILSPLNQLTIALTQYCNAKAEIPNFRPSNASPCKVPHGAAALLAPPSRRTVHNTATLIMPPPLGWGVSADARLTSVAYIGPKSRTVRHRKTKIGTEVGLAHVTIDSDTTFKVKGQQSTCRRRGILFRPLAQLVVSVSITRSSEPYRPTSAALIQYDRKSRHRTRA